MRRGVPLLRSFDPEKEQGVILAFRQERCTRDTLKVRLPFASADGIYRILDEDSGKEREAGRDFAISFGEPRTARLLWINKV